MSASRLSGKVMLELAGAPMLAHVIRRTRRASMVNEVIVATTTAEEDDAVVNLCQTEGIHCQRGSQYDVLDRYYQTARRFGATTIVRITADCPVIDPGLIDETIKLQRGLVANPEQVAYIGRAAQEKLGGMLDFAANRLPPPWGRTFPIGLDVEVCTFAGLELAWREASRPHQREHVMPFFYDQPERFHIGLLNHVPDYGALRWTVDTPADMDLLRRIYTHFDGRDDFTWLEVLTLVQQHPDLAQINARVTAKDYRATDARSAATAQRLDIKQTDTE